MAEKLRKRNEIPEQYKWKLTDIYATVEDWEKAYEEIGGKIADFAKYDGKVAEDPRKVIREYFALYDELMPVFEYAFLNKETDNGDPAAQAMSDRVRALGVKAGTASAFMQPELLDLDESLLTEMMNDPDMADYSVFLGDLLRDKAHALPKEQERLLAMMGEVAGAPNTIFSMLTDVDMKFPAITLEDGSQQELTEGNYSSFIHGDNREARKQAFEGIMGTYGKFGNTIAATYGGSVKNDIFQAAARKYSSALAVKMEPLQIPQAVYDNLIEVIHEYLPVLNEYLELRKQVLGLDELHMYDLYCPMVSDFHMDMPYEKAFDLVLEGLKPMGEDYVAKLVEARDNGWIDVYPSENKSSGAFSAGGLAKVHPYVLLNHNDNLDCAFTIAHELGHAMHSYYSNKTQPSPKADYSLFVAEVASTCNEAVMMRHLLSTLPEKKAQAYLLNHFLEQFRTTCFRQTMFAEFERISHDMAAKGQPLTKESLSKAYYELNQKYYGGACEVDEIIANEWMRIPHFYRSFYVYVYATGLCAAVSLSDRILTEGESAVADYRKFLSAGCSVPPIEALKLAGIDMSSPEPLRKAMEVFKDTLAKFKAVL
ncbi:MAG: oligoendopeptidase F [Clostridia bacterium]|nr:oligoendopeptidase F [Clostridia bacterium]